MARRIVPLSVALLFSLTLSKLVSDLPLSFMAVCILILSSRFFHWFAGTWAGVISAGWTATCAFSPTSLKLACHEILSRLALLRASSIAQ